MAILSTAFVLAISASGIALFGALAYANFKNFN